MSRKVGRGRILGLVGVRGLLLIVAAAFAVAVSASPPDDLQAVKAATARYHSFEQALRDGYSVAGEPCVASPLGTMGIHAANQALMADPAIDPLHPEILLYVPDEHGTLKLAAVEYFKADADGNLATHGDRPAILGQAFRRPHAGTQPDDAGSLRPARLDLEGQPFRALRAVQPGSLVSVRNGGTSDA